MSQPARVHSIDALRDFQAALARFREEAQNALYAAESEIQHTLDALQERLVHWQRQVRQWQEELVRAKTELIQRRWGAGDGRGPGATEAELAVKLAQQRLKEAEEKVELVRRWQRTLPQAIQEYQGPARQLAGMLDTQVKKSMVLLDNKIDALEAYASVAPSAPALPAVAPAPANPEAPPAEGDAR